MIDQNKKRLGIVLVVVFLLLIPLIAMQLTDEVNWKFLDFIAAGILLTGVGFLLEFVIRKVKKTATMIAVCTCLLLALILVWIELAVGIFDTPFAGN